MVQLKVTQRYIFALRCLRLDIARPIVGEKGFETFFLYLSENLKILALHSTDGNTVKLVTTTTLVGTPNLWLFLTDGRSSEVGLCYEDSKWWSL